MKRFILASLILLLGCSSPIIEDKPEEKPIEENGGEENEDNGGITMAYNWAADPSTIWSISACANGTSTTVGSQSNVYDEDTGTYYGIYGKYGPSSTGLICTTIATATLDEARDITNIVFKIRNTSYSTKYFVGVGVKYYDGSWHDGILGSSTIKNQCDGWSVWGTGEKYTSGIKTYDENVNWSNVTKVEFIVTAQERYGYNTYAYIYEAEINGEAPYDDIGIKVYNGSSAIKIGTEDLDGHKLRVRKGGTTYGIPLLSTTNDFASPIRIYDGTSVKALPKID